MRSNRFPLMGVLAACGLVGIAVADNGRLPANEQPTQLLPENIRTMHVTPRGVIEMPDWGTPFGERACGVVVSRTTASFSGGTYTLQGGLAQGEIIGVTYDVPAGEWPIKLDLAEVIVGTQATIVATTTEWSILVYEGTPTNGQLIRTESSDDVVLPHIQIPAGTNGVNLNFSVDPGDPDQIIINSFPGNPNKFTIAFRIDRHNTPGADPACDAPPSNRNAFPATDNTVIGCGSGYAQLNFPTQNWLFANTCAFGCQAGWSTFASLQADTNIGGFCLTGCRPRGDWVLRATYSSLSCTPGVGSCCLPDGSCNTLTQADCASANGTYNGDGSSCASVNCSGACCLPDGNCIITSSGDCAFQNGSFRGLGTTCETANCPQPTGACCLNNGAFCLVLTQSNCAGAGGVFQGPSTVCGANQSCPTGACCLPNGTCSITSPANCALQSGTYRGNNTSCATANCPQPDGACCFANGFCLSLSAANCAGAGGSFAGGGTTCPGACGPNCNDIDFNNDGSSFDPTDIDSFLSIFSEGPCVPETATCDDIDFNNDGSLFDPCDIDSFLLVFSEGPCTLCGQ
jgi:hypothetical protein